MTASLHPALEQANQYKSIYGEAIPGHVLAERLGSFMHLFNLYGCARATTRVISWHGASPTEQPSTAR